MQGRNVHCMNGWILFLWSSSMKLTWVLQLLPQPPPQLCFDDMELENHVTFFFFPSMCHQSCELPTQKEWSDISSLFLSPLHYLTSSFPNPPSFSPLPCSGRWGWCKTLGLMADPMARLQARWWLGSFRTKQRCPTASPSLTWTRSPSLSRAWLPW